MQTRNRLRWYADGYNRKIGSALQDRKDIKVGDRIASLVSLSLTLHIEEILAVHPETDRVDIKGKQFS